MRFMKNIFGRIWAIWGAIWLIFTLLLFFLPFSFCYLLPEPSRSNVSYYLYKWWMIFFLPPIGVFIKIRGKHNFINGNKYIVTCNHNSLFDILVSSPQIPGPNKTIAKKELANIPVFGAPYKLGSILVDRKDRNSRANSYKQMRDALQKGFHMCIYPEGTRNKSTEPIKEFQNGAFKLAVETQTEIIPALLFGTKNILPNDKTFYLMPGIIEFHFLNAVSPGNDAIILKEKVFEIMKTFILSKHNRQ